MKNLLLILVIEAGGRHVSLVVDDYLHIIHRFASRFVLHGEPDFSFCGRYVYLGSRDGLITKCDLLDLFMGAEVLCGIG